MGYQPGPLFLQSEDNVGVETTDYNFTGDAHDQLSDLNTLPASWDSFLDDAAILLQESSDPFPDVDLNTSQLVLRDYADPAALIGYDALLTAYGDAEVALGNAIAFSPLEAWASSPAPFVAPAPAEVLGVPYIPPGFLSVSVQGNTGAVLSAADLARLGPPSGLGPPTLFPIDGGYHVPTPPAISVSFINISQYGNPNFRVGDQWQMTASGAPGSTVYAYATLNDEPVGGGPTGTIQDDGRLVVVGVMLESQIGVWSEQWLVDSSPVATYNFVVVGSEE